MDKSKEKIISQKTVIKYLILFAVITLIKFTLFNFSIVKGASMEPTLKESDITLAAVQGYLFNEINRGDIVILNAPDGSGKLYIKRVVGMPGDKIKIEGTKTFINDLLIEEPYVNKSYELENNYLELTLKPDEFFVMGDNRNVSEDSRAFGPVSKTEIKSVVKQVFKTSIIKNIF